MQFIEFRLFWEGRVNRSDLVNYFDISTAQASSDLAGYQAVAGDKLRYDRRTKAYVAEPGFRPRLIELSARGYLAQLRLLADDVLSADQAWPGWLPPFAVLPLVRRRLEPGKLREILDAIHASAGIRILYQSFSRPEPMWRWIVPHALGFDGHRWHVRAWCCEREEFVDFVFARMLETDDRRPEDVDASDDLEWQLEVKARLAPHPNMDEKHRRVTELDFGMENGVVEVPMRLCLAYYFIRQLNLDADPSSTPPSRQQVVLLNREEIDTLQKAMHDASKQRVANRRNRALSVPSGTPRRGGR
jgi:hypothetical protein